MKALVALSAVLALGAAQYSPVGYPYSGYSPVSYYAAGAYNHYAPTAYSVAPAAAVSSQYHAQDELGQFNYGYAGGPSAKNEFRRFDGATVGSYSYIDANGKVQTVSYTADDVGGFQVKATNLPVAPEANLQAPEFNLEAPVFDGVAPEPVQDTAEVAAAKAEFREKYAEAAATFKTATLDKVEADTPADTSLLKVTEKEHETYVPSVVPYAAPAVHYTAPVVSYAVPEVKKVEVKHVASPITYAASPLPLAYGLHPYGYGAPLIYNVEAKEENAAVEEAAEEEPAVTATLDKVEADTPADTTLLEVTEKEHETYVPSVVSYAAHAVHYTAPVVRYAVPEVKKVEVKAAPITYAASPLPLTYGLHPYSFGTPLIYNVEAKAAEVDEKAE
ncbi:cuticle protein-like [Pollicipes pollicipes]|uniref:cuticle protein-like n=1 Tax=Pollicipes pollicipes TaxID=41117 RepID=UPI001884D2BC|nr:cuticle protein-like [Pollicipes pollicipes]